MTKEAKEMLTQLKMAGWTLKDLTEFVSGVQSHLDDKKSKENAEEEAAREAELAEFLSKDKDVLAFRKLVEDADAGLQELDGKTVKVTLNIPVTFSVNLSAQHSDAADFVKTWSDDIDNNDVFDCDGSDIIIGKGELTPFQRKIVQQWVNSSDLAICADILLLADEEGKTARDAVKNINKAKKLLKAVRDKGHGHLAVDTILGTDE